MSSKARLTVDMSLQEHSYLKMACAKLGMTMREFMVRASLEKLEQIEDDILAEKAHQILERINAGQEKVFSWKKAKSRLK